MLTLPGASSLSSFRLEKLLSEIQRLDPDVSEISAAFIHFVDLTDDLSPEQTEQLNKLLDYGEAATTPAPDAYKLLVVPRGGTISPWSSKATEIAQRCGLSSVRRLERGIQYAIQTSTGLALANNKQAVFALLHDRMTQRVIETEMPIELFSQHEPLSLQTVAIIEQGRPALVEATRQLGLALSGD